MVASRNMTIKRDTLFEVVKKYVAPENYENLLADLTVCLQSSESFQEAEVKNDLGLLRFLDSSRISIWDTAKNWRDSIRKAGKCLLECGSIDKKYLDTVISQIQYYGPYMFLTEDVIVAHAKPEDGVNCLDVSLSVFHKPVVFAENRRAKLVFLLAAEDQEKHLKILQDILVLVSNQNQIDAIADSSSVPYLLSLMKLILDKSEND